MGLEINYFYSLTPRQFNNITKGHATKTKLKLQLHEANLKQQWEQTRLLAYWIVKMNADPKKFGNKTPQQFMPFEHEKETANKLKKPALTQQELKELFKNLP